jgi:hypothetical protein
MASQQSERPQQGVETEPGPRETFIDFPNEKHDPVPDTVDVIFKVMHPETTHTFRKVTLDTKVEKLKQVLQNTLESRPPVQSQRIIFMGHPQTDEASVRSMLDRVPTLVSLYKVYSSLADSLLGRNPS